MHLGACDLGPRVFVFPLMKTAPGVLDVLLAIILALVAVAAVWLMVTAL